MAKHSSDCDNLRARLLLSATAPAALVATLLAVAPPVGAQTSPFFSPSTHAPAVVDQNGVELGTGQFVIPTAGAGIGNAQSGMSDSLGGMKFPNGSQLIGGVNNDDGNDFALEASKPGAFSAKINYGSHSSGIASYNWAAGTAMALEGGETFDFGGPINGPNPYSGLVLWTLSDGTIVELDGALASDLNLHANHAAVSRVIKPDGEILSYSYDRQQISTGDPDGGMPGHPEFVVQSYVSSIKSSLGWEMNGSFHYGQADLWFANRAYATGNLVAIGASITNWNVSGSSLSNNPYMTTKKRLTHKLLATDAVHNYFVKQSVEERNLYSYDNVDMGEEFYLRRTTANVPVEYLSEAMLPSNAIHWYFYTYIEKVEVESLSGVKTTIDYYRAPDDFSQANSVYGGCSGAPGAQWPITCVNTVTRGTSVWKYTWSPAANPGVTVDIEDPLGRHRLITTSTTYQGQTLITRDQDELGRVTTYEYDGVSLGLLTKATHPEGNYEQYFYDARQNLIESRTYPKGGGTPIILTAGYDTVCTNLKTCNKPNWTKDALGRQTDYEYAAAHGGVTKVTLPAVTDPVNGQQVRPQTRYEYAQLMPNTLPTAALVWRLVKESSCRTATAANPAACVGTENELVKEYAYNNLNLLRTSETVRAGNAVVANPYNATTNLWSRTTSTYDVYGNVTIVDGPLDIAVADDRSYKTYDNRRRPVFEIGVDPDGVAAGTCPASGAGCLPRPIVKHYYDNDGREYRTEQGIGHATDGSDFVVKSYVDISFDAVTGLPVKTASSMKP